MGRRLDDNERQDIADALRAGHSVRAVADVFSRSPSTVSKIGKAAGIDLDGSQTAAATARRSVDHRAQVLDEATAALADARELRAMWFGSGVLHHWHKGEHHEAVVDSLPAREIQALAIAWGIAVQRSMELHEYGDLLDRIEELEAKAAAADEGRP